LQKLADETGLTICVFHFPPGTSKWNKIEHRLFSQHQPNLARPPADQLPGDHQLNRGNNDQQRAEGVRSARSARLPQ
jgi:Rhodopirellula transposase DDE domain